MNVREVRADGRTVAVREWGSPAGMPFIFWHALGPGHGGASFAVAAEPLATAGCRVLAVDAPGFGRSPAAGDEDYGLERLAARMLYDSGASDFADHPLADLTATKEQLVESAREYSSFESWDRLVELLRAEGLDQAWNARRVAGRDQDRGRRHRHGTRIGRGAGRSGLRSDARAAERTLVADWLDDKSLP